MYVCGINGYIYFKFYDKKFFFFRYKVFVIVQIFKVLNVFRCYYCSFGIKVMIVVNIFKGRNSYDYKGKGMKFLLNGIENYFWFQ